MKVKQPKTFKEQVDSIINKGIIVSDNIACHEFFNRVNYYRFSAYFLPFKRSDKTYHSGTSFERARHIYDFDAKMRNLIFRTIDDIEMALRTQLAYYHTHKYGPLGYLDTANFNNDHNKDGFQKRLTILIQENKNSPVVKHHQTNYSGSFPLWVIIEFFSTGMLSYFFSDLKLTDKKLIASVRYNTTPQHVTSWLRCLSDLRNRCAHHSRLYYWVFPAIPKIRFDTAYEPTRRLFDQILVLNYLYPDRSQWRDSFLPSLENLIEEYSEYIDLKHIGFPKEWFSILNSI